MGRLVSLKELVSIRAALRGEGKRVVFTNGCFDIIHRGHIEYLAKAKALGDALIVGGNSDESVRRIKGERRPIIEEADRTYIVANLSPVDYVCMFGEDTPLGLISAIVPDVLVKGDDWKIDDIVGKDVVEQSGGRVATIDFVPNRSSSSIIDRIVERFATRG